MPENLQTLRDGWRNDFSLFRKSLDRYKAPLPSVCAYELSHAISHIVAAYERGNDYSLRMECITSARNHVRRAHLDFLKIIITQIHKDLYSRPDIEKRLNFQKHKIRARLVEFDRIGSSHENTIEQFRAIIDLYGTPNLPVRNGSEPLPGHTHVSDSLRGSNPETARLPQDPRQRGLLKQLIRLDLVFTSLHGKKLYRVSYNMLNSYIKNTDVCRELEDQIANLKMWIMGLAIKLDHNNELQTELAKNSTYVDVIRPAISELKDSRKDRRSNAHRVLLQNIDQVFPLVLGFLNGP